VFATHAAKQMAFKWYACEDKRFEFLYRDHISHSLDPHRGQAWGVSVESMCVPAKSTCPFGKMSCFFFLEVSA
jgi:hypothetical protein